MDNSGQNKLIIILSGILVAALLAAGAIIFLLPSNDSGSTSSVTDTAVGLLSRFQFSSSDSDSTTPRPSPPDFQTSVLDRGSYQQLNTTLIENGLLPVRPDPAAGKANPFL